MGAARTQRPRRCPFPGTCPACYDFLVADSDQKLPAETQSQKLDRLLEKRPPLPPEPLDARWTWTKQKLKAVYLEAFTQMGKGEIAEAIGVRPKALYVWRRAPDYRRYLATLIAADGLADRAERVKARKNLADSLQKAIADKLKTPGALAGEKLSSLLRAQREMLDALQEDATELQELGAEQDAAARAGQKRPALDLAERIQAIADPTERETVKRHLLKLMGDYLDAPTVMDAAPVIESAPEGERAEAEDEARSGAVGEQSAAASGARAEQSSGQDLGGFIEDEPTTTAEPAQSAPSVSADDFAAD